MQSPMIIVVNVMKVVNLHHESDEREAVPIISMTMVSFLTVGTMRLLFAKRMIELPSS